ncbi:WRKY transcription factor 44-like [Salvia divinorum]|uniref:WRKY transcription factor 44-like n=1 Tax=Salvia divinorum TaxID=28513 RepID=A0ABD1GP25_SALDI
MMEIEEKEKIVIAKPVACRPRFSNPKSLPVLLSVTTDASPPPAFTEAATIIRPTTVRFKPDSTIDLAEAAACHPTKRALESNTACSVVYKPIAKLVSRTTVSLLSNLGGNSIAPTQEVGEDGNRMHSSNQVTHQSGTTLEIHPDFPTQSEHRATTPVENHTQETKFSIPANIRDRPSYDGHNWRKYGQKQVKGSEYPRSYYRCTYPNCPVKKKVEKSLDGQIAEIVYNGEHTHLKSQPPDHTPADGHTQPLVYDAARKEVQSHVINQQAEAVRAHQGGSEIQDHTETSNQSNFCGAPPANYTVASAACNAGRSVSHNSLDECEEVGRFVEAEGGDFRSKRTESKNQLPRASMAGEASSNHQIVVQNNTDSGIIGDGFRWRKYGQKVVRGKMYPRSYYRCTNPDCNVRKYVERTSEDPGTFITTYEGKHSHAMPMKTANVEASKTSTKN